MKSKFSNNFNEQLVLHAEFFIKIEEAVSNNNSTSIAYAKRQLKLVLNSLMEGKSIFIEDLNIQFNTIGEYKKWKKDRDKLNTFNSELLIKEIKLSKLRNQKR